jgi:hypothetical protein
MTALDAQVELHRNRAALTDLAGQLERAQHGLPHLSGADWKGPAAWAFRVAVDSLRHELALAAITLREVERLTDLAARQVVAGG